MNCNKKSHFDNSTSVRRMQRGWRNWFLFANEERGEIFLSFTSTKIREGGRTVHYCVLEQGVLNC